MAGNIVKWWKHKILGGYKQFSVQECTTDSEELMYHQVRASSSCSAPPDLLLVNDRENNIPLRSEVSDVIGAATTPPSIGLNACPDLPPSNNNQRLQHQQQNHHQQQQQQKQQQHLQQQTHVASYNNSSKDVNGRHQKVVGSKQVLHNKQQQPLDNEGHVETQQNYTSTRHAHHHHQQRPEEHIRLEEFTCDVSVEGGKSSQPLQFSFTFYDLDGHHGKITKDDIVGIVYTIYESIGKSVVVPHSGSKTINVRLTVSPDEKSKASKAKKQQNATSQKDKVIPSARRLHRYRPRKLIKSDEEDDDSNSDKEDEGASVATNINNHILNKLSKTNRTTKTKDDQQCCQHKHNQQCVDISNPDTIYEHLKKSAAAESCRECLTAVEETRNATISPTTHSNLAAASHFPSKSHSNESYMKHIASTRIKMLRKSRKQKYQDCVETRQRSLSVGSEACWNNRHIQKPTQQQTHWKTDQYLNSSDMLDGVQMRNPLSSEKLPMAQKRNSAECWKSALNRNDLISIIRESMEKNRLCFQLNGKPQANVSPIRQSSDHQHLLLHKHGQRQTTHYQRQRANTVSKIPMLIANHSYRSSSFSNNDLSPNDHHNNSSYSNNIYQLQQHIPIYDSHMAMNPMIMTPPNGVHATNSGSRPAAGHHTKSNLCGYDSFLHATICGGGLSHSPPPHTTMHSQSGATANSHHSLPQQIATVQPIMSSLNTNSQRAPKNMGLSMTPNQIRTSKILRSGSYSQSHHTAFASSQNSPQHNGYQRLCPNNRQNLSALNPEKSQIEMLDKGRKEQVKNYDQLLYAKLTEKLQQTNIGTTNMENMNRRRHRLPRHRRSSATVAEANKVCVPAVSFTKTSDYSSLIPIGADPVECENLIVPSDDESQSHYDMVTKGGMDVQIESAISRHVAEGTLVDIGDCNRNEKSNSITNEILGMGSDTNNIHLDDELGVDDELDEELADRVKIGLNKSGRSSAASKETNEDIVANASGTNTSATSSLIHRYVHEHIHHHYHHFEDNNE